MSNNESVLNFHNIHCFLSAIRKSDMEININVNAQRINYEFSSGKPFAENKWKKTLLYMVESKEITSNQADVFDKFIQELLKNK